MYLRGPHDLVIVDKKIAESYNDEENISEWNETLCEINVK